MNVENKADVAESSLQCGLKIQLMFYSHSCQIKLKKIKGKLHGIGSHQGQNQVTYCLKKKEGGVRLETFSLLWLKISGSARDDLEYFLLGDLLDVGLGSSVFRVDV